MLISIFPSGIFLPEAFIASSYHFNQTKAAGDFHMSNRCGGEMRIIAFIKDYKVVKKILDYLGIYETQRKRPPPRIEAAPDEFDDYICDDYIECDHVY